jgi:arginyl-tRNA synthetase
MINAQQILHSTVQQALSQIYNLNNPIISFQKTRKEFEGDFTLVTFPYTKETKNLLRQNRLLFLQAYHWILIQSY